ncbi:MAG: 3-dehydroquinate synthase [Candidatus Atribacteria bacterium]|nr:3-dehydroquinate synthase [Candidatus Atribacteria bacterium]
MQNLLIQTRDKQYTVLILPQVLSSSDWLNHFLFPSQKGVIITNTTVGPLYEQGVQQLFHERGFDIKTITIPDGEEYKQLTTVEHIYHELLKLGLDRKSFLVALGGGVITDITGFVASTYLRGIPYLQIPTSLLAQVDSSVGGKTGVNIEEGKNLIGTFYQPDGVIVGLDFLKSLPDREFREGLSEIMKAAFLSGGDFFEFFQKNIPLILKRDQKILEELISQSIQFKGEIVQKDEKESGVRSILNYGHTLGHAFEKTLGYGALRHGEAVAVGMMGAAIIAERMGMISADLVNIHQELLVRCGLPISFPYSIKVDTFIQSLLKDKKNVSGSLRMVLLKAIGKPAYSVQVEMGLVLDILPQLVEVEP